MILKFLGADAGFGDENNSAYIENGNKLLLIDCGMTVFSKLKNALDLSKFDDIKIVITHLHNDHAGSLSQVIMLFWFLYNKQVTVISKCAKIDEYLQITGTPKESYIIKDKLDNLEIIKTEHADQLDCYGFTANFENKKIVYTGDTKTLLPFMDYINDSDELYVDMSKNGGVHLKLDDCIELLEGFTEKRNFSLFNAY